MKWGLLPMANRAELGGVGSGSAQFRGAGRRRPLSQPDAPAEYRVTSVGETPTEERAHRMHAYFITMSLRLACVASLAFVRGWWVLIPAVGAVVLPYFAVLIANAVGNRDGAAPDAFTPQALTGQSPASSSDDFAKPAGLIVVDAPAERRANGTARSSADSGGDRPEGEAAL